MIRVMRQEFYGSVGKFVIFSEIYMNNKIYVWKSRNFKTNQKLFLNSVILKKIGLKAFF